MSATTSPSPATGLHEQALSVAIVSNDCWGGDCYRYIGQRYLSPFVGLFIHGPCYVAIVEDIAMALRDDVRTLRRSRYTNRRPDYPLLGLSSVDAELHMLHYQTATAARAAWRRRADRAAGLPTRVKASIGKDAFTHYHVARLFELEPAALVLGPVNYEDRRVVRCRRFDPSTVNFEESLREFNLVRWLSDGVVQQQQNVALHR